MKWDEFTRTLKVHQKYHIGGQQVPSVTTVLQNIGWKTAGLLRWAERIHAEDRDQNQERDAAAAVGATAHYLVQCWVNETEPDLSRVAPIHAEFAMQAYANFQRWVGQTEVQPIASEVKVLSAQYRYGGTADLICQIDGVRTLVDLKTSGGDTVYAESKIQVAAYALAYNEEHDDAPVRRLCVLQMGRETGACVAHFLSPEEWAAGQDAFLRARDLHELRKTLNKKARR